MWEKVVAELHKAVSDYGACVSPKHLHSALVEDVHMAEKLRCPDHGVQVEVELPMIGEDGKPTRHSTSLTVLLPPQYPEDCLAVQQVRTKMYLSPLGHRLAAMEIPTEGGLLAVFEYVMHCDMAMLALRHVRLETEGGPLVRSWFHFHHLASVVKRGLIRDWSADLLGLTGVVAGGQPGFVVAEGPARAVESLHECLRLFSWRSMHCIRSQPIDQRCCEGMVHLPPSFLHAHKTSHGRDLVDFPALLRHWGSSDLACDLADLTAVFEGKEAPESCETPVAPPPAPPSKQPLKKKKSRLQ
eukprot:Sspe_Gene.65339::Locus_38685_Transcript_1_1_Confidence_1.000_Length_1042::g.65339::m.65339